MTPKIDFIGATDAPYVAAAPSVAVLAAGVAALVQDFDPVADAPGLAGIRCNLQRAVLAYGPTPELRAIAGQLAKLSGAAPRPQPAPPSNPDAAAAARREIAELDAAREREAWSTRRSAGVEVMSAAPPSRTVMAPSPAVSSPSAHRAAAAQLNEFRHGVLLANPGETPEQYKARRAALATSASPPVPEHHAVGHRDIRRAADQRLADQRAATTAAHNAGEVEDERLRKLWHSMGHPYGEIADRLNERRRLRGQTPRRF